MGRADVLFGREMVVTIQRIDASEGSIADLVWTAVTILRGSADRDSVTIVAETAASAPLDALREGLRSIVQASVKERPTLRANAVVGGTSTNRGQTAEFIEDAEFVFGTVIDLGDSR